MKSKISFFNRGLCKNLLRRCWPMWTAYTAVLIFIYPVFIFDCLRWTGKNTISLDRHVLQAGTDMAIISIIVGVLMAMVMFSYLYSARSSGMISALPLRRETVFFTAYLTGLVPMLIADVLVVLLTYAFTAGTGYFTLGAYLESLAAVLMANVAFYSFAVFCAMLTGSIIILPLVYLVLNLTAFVAESAVRALLSDFVYGMNYDRIVLEPFSPIVTILSSLSVRRVSPMDETLWYIDGMGYLAAYCAAGLVLALLALAIYRRRHMETATDVVAVPVLKPVFKYCMTGGAAVVFAVIISSNFLNTLTGFSKALLIMLMMFIGAFIGYYIAEMLMQKTVHVFRGRWKGYWVSCAVIALLVLAFETDVFGYERYLPEAENVRSVEISQGSAVLEEPENIEKLLLLHESIIENKPQHEAARSKYYIGISYHMDNGSVISREYWLSGDGENQNDPDSDLHEAFELTNSNEAIEKRCRMSIPLRSETVSDFYVYWHHYTPDGRYEEQVLQLSSEEAEKFYRDYLIHDISSGTMGRNWWLQNDEYYSTVTNVRIEIALSNRGLISEEELKDELRHEYFTFRVCLDAEYCMRWLEENTEIEPMSLWETEAPLRAIETDEGDEEVISYNYSSMYN